MGRAAAPSAAHRRRGRHNTYFCGPDAKRTLKQAKQERGDGGQSESTLKAMRTLKITKDGETLPPPAGGGSGRKKHTPMAIYGDLMAEAGRQTMSMYESAKGAEAGPAAPPISTVEAVPVDAPPAASGGKAKRGAQKADPLKGVLVAELRSRLEALGLPTAGKKGELKERLQAAMSAAAPREDAVCSTAAAAPTQLGNAIEPIVLSSSSSSSDGDGQGEAPPPAKRRSIVRAATAATLARRDDVVNVSDGSDDDAASAAYEPPAGVESSESESSELSDFETLANSQRLAKLPPGPRATEPRRAFPPPHRRAASLTSAAQAARCQTAQRGPQAGGERQGQG